MPPDLANDFAYSSVSSERQTPVAPLPPKGPSPSMPVNMCWNIELRNTASKSCAAAWAFASFPTAGALAADMLFVSTSSGLRPGAGIARPVAITSPRCQPGLRLQDRDQVARPNAHRVEPVNNLLQRYAFAYDKYFLSILLDSDTGPRHHARSSTREGQRLTDFGCFRNGHRQVALRDRDRRHPYVAADNNNARPFVDHDARRQIG